VAAFLGLALASYSRLDPSINRVVSQGHELGNMAGLVGAYASGLLVDFFGVAAWFWPLLFFYFAAASLTERVSLAWWRWVGIVLVIVSVMTWAESATFKASLALGGVVGGGLFGTLLFGVSQTLLRPLGAGLVWLFLFLFGLQLAIGVSWSNALRRLRDNMQGAAQSPKERSVRKGRKPLASDDDETIDVAPVGGRRVTGIPPPPEADTPVVFDAPGLLGRTAREVSRVPSGEGGSSRGGDDLFSFPSLFGRERDEEKVEEPNFAFENEEAPSIESVADDFAFEDFVEEPRGASDASAPAAVKAKSRPSKSRPARTPALPRIDLLSPVVQTRSPLDKERLKAMALDLVSCLSDFGVKGEVTAIKPGPVVTMFEVKPAPGTKISRIAGLADDLALAMKALAVRIDAIPGSDAVGVEIPNETREGVALREIFESEAFKGAPSKLALALGKDIQGRAYVADLARMPHLLVAGATGAGKSVSLNTILLSLLYKATPDEVKLLLVDPKRIELSVYADLPHLVHPVVTEMPLAKSALEWAVAEMDRRYQAMALLGVRNIESYNQKLPQADVEAKPQLAELAPIPYLVIIIDELADLMMTAGKEAEMSIVRLAQLARAAGIHLILATQRPSVDVVTGLIKANFPTRLSFQVTSKHDSRTILDMGGAERLLGRGDSLFKPSGGKVVRVHGAYVDEEDIARVVDHWRAQCPQSFEVDFEAWAQEQAGEAVEGEPGAMDADPMYREAVEFVSAQGKASISLLQRRFRIGFNRAARFIEQMELDGMLGPQEGAKPRAVLRGRE